MATIPPILSIIAVSLADAGRAIMATPPGASPTNHVIRLCMEIPQQQDSAAGHVVSWDDWVVRGDGAR